MGMDVCSISEPQIYFRASAWTWRPIQIIIENVNSSFELGIDTEGFGENSGFGVKDPEKCVALGEAIMQSLHKFGLESEGSNLYVAIGSLWLDESGTFIGKERVQEYGLDSLSGKAFNNPVVTEDGTLVEPAYSVQREDVIEFCKFLGVCEGFLIF